MNRRHLLALVGLAFLALTAGCFGPGAISEEQLDQEPAAAYEWDTARDAHITIQTDSSFRAVYNVSGAGEELELFRRDGFGGRNPLNVRAVRFRYPNGTVVSGSELESRGGDISRTRDEVTVRFPNGTDRGQLAFTAGATPKRFSLPVFVEGSYEVVLPPDRRVDIPVFGSVSPRGFSTEQIDSRTHITWEEVSSRSVSVQYYLQRDIPIFGAIALISIVIGLGGAYYYKRQIEELREVRQEMGLNVEIEEDDDGPPPGMR